MTRKEKVMDSKDKTELFKTILVHCSPARKNMFYWIIVNSRMEEQTEKLPKKNKRNGYLRSMTLSFKMNFILVY